MLMPRRVLALVLLASAALLGSACGFDVAPVRGPADPAPVFDQDFPDPAIVRVGSSYVALSTNSHLGTIPALVSSDLHAWRVVGDAVPTLPNWAQPGAVWAPDVLPLAGRFVLYFAVIERATGRHCLAAMAADDAVGPYEEARSGPLLCTDGTSTIDPSAFRMPDGSLWLLWKSEPVGGAPARIWSARLAADGLALVDGTAVPLLEPATSYEAHTPSVPGSGNIENPTMLVHSAGLFLFYSAHLWNGSSYNIAVASCASPSGPCTRVYDTPLLGSRGSMLGPGGPTIVGAPDGRLFVGFHAWRGITGYPEGYRPLYVMPLAFEGGRPVVG